MIKIQAHRGYSTAYPENTMLAFQKAVEVGSHAIEMDVHYTSDNQLVIIHDYTIDRTNSNGVSGNVTAYSLSYLKTLDFSYSKKFGKIFEGNVLCKIPTLDEVLDGFINTNVEYVLHLQYDNTTYLNQVYNLVNSKNLLDRVIFFAAVDTLNKFKGFYPNTRTMNSGMISYSQFANMLANAIEHNHQYISVNNTNSNYNMERMVNQANANGIELHVSYLNNYFSSRTKELNDIGVSHILGDNPSLMLNYEQPLFTGDGPVIDMFVKDGKWKKVEKIVEVL